MCVFVCVCKLMMLSPGFMVISLSSTAGLPERGAM